jgi:hypothetical protein
MSRVLLGPVVVLLAVTGCSDHRGTPAAAPAPAPSASPSATHAPPQAVCRLVNDQAFRQSLDAALAIGGTPGAAMRAEVSQTFTSFGQQITLTVLGDAPPELAEPLGDWAGAAIEVGYYIAKTKPKKGIVIDFGPGYDRFTAAQKATEKVCGHKLGNASYPSASPS